ncbi:radical SAM family heme chaperone HemW [Mycolicibacterium sp.]|uniref:radical SAM family heme chaperone HemW n=1 Tax=Mycolicibacterium sp. TaxID=2320850 RepID=UPI0025CE861E|nr:radical SAM family heme chaperone HemW [Mycolicibacterium sp.]
MVPELALTPGTQFGLYLHVPFCTARCGYCDFNTYTPSELGGAELGGATPDGWLAALRAELEMAAARVGSAPVDSVFVGGGTPSSLGGARLAAVLAAVRDNFTLAAGAEVTTEANPESTSPEFFDTIRGAGYTRVSLGMQSASPHVLAVLGRAHSPGRAIAAAAEAAAAGFDHLNLDLIYGTPGESDDDLLASVEAALGAGVDHVSAYALVVEDGTALARQVRRGEVAAPDDDVLARRYELLDSRLSAAGLDWYEVSNWSRPGGQCRHNLGYWNGGQWWGAGPGAHSFVGDLRWWNVKHPNAYAEALGEGRWPAADSERLDARDRHIEEVMLGIRLREGLALSALTGSERARAMRGVDDGLLSAAGGRLTLTLRGRLLADAVVREVLDD